MLLALQGHLCLALFPTALVPVTVVELLDQAPAVSEPDLDVGDGLRLIDHDGRTGFGFVLCLLGWRAGAHHLGRGAANRETQGELLETKLTWLQGTRSGSKLTVCQAQLPGSSTSKLQVRIFESASQQELVYKFNFTIPFGATGSHTHKLTGESVTWEHCSNTTHQGGSRPGIWLLAGGGWATSQYTSVSLASLEEHLPSHRHPVPFFQKDESEGSTSQGSSDSLTLHVVNQCHHPLTCPASVLLQ